MPRSPATWYSEGLRAGRASRPGPMGLATRPAARTAPAGVLRCPAPASTKCWPISRPAGARPPRSARYRIAHDSAASEVVLDQGAVGVAPGPRWASTIWARSRPSVELGDITGDDGRAVRFDAIKWLPRPDTAPPDARVTEAGPYSGGSVLVRWGGADDVSGIASYDVQVRQLPAAGWSDWQLAAVVGEAAFAPQGRRHLCLPRPCPRLGRPRAALARAGRSAGRGAVARSARGFAATASRGVCLRQQSLWLVFTRTGKNQPQKKLVATTLPKAEAASGCDHMRLCNK